MIDGGGKHKALGYNGRCGDHIDAAVEPVYKKRRQTQLHQDYAHIQMENPPGISSGPLNGYVDAVKEVQHGTDEIQDKVGGSFCDKFLRRFGKAQKLGCEGNQDQQESAPKDPTEGKKGADPSLD